jgi:hypothetical protein
VHKNLYNTLKTDPKEHYFQTKKPKVAQKKRLCDKQECVPRFDIAAPSCCSLLTQRQFCDTERSFT